MALIARLQRFREPATHPFGAFRICNAASDHGAAGTRCPPPAAASAPYALRPSANRQTLSVCTDPVLRDVRRDRRARRFAHGSVTTIKPLAPRDPR